MNKVTAQLLDHHFDTAFAAPDGIKKLRELILTLAMQGKLVAQDPNDPPASELLKEIEAEKQWLVKEGKIKKPKSLPEINEGGVPYQLPQGWKWVRLDDVAKYIQRGKGPRYAEISEVPVISQKCIQWRGFDRRVVRYLDLATLDKYAEERFVREGDLLWNSTGTGTIGRINLYRNELCEFDKVVADSHVTVVRLVGINNDFALRFLMSPIIQSTIEANASGTTNQIELNTSTIKEQHFPLPPLPEQQRIVTKIDQLMARCDELEKLHAEREQLRFSVHTAAIKQLLDAVEQDENTRAWQFITRHFGELYTVKENVAELRKTIIQLAVMGKLVPQNPNDPPASELLKEIETEKQQLVKEGKIKKPKPTTDVVSEDTPFSLPGNWQWARLLSISKSIDYGTSQKTGNDSSLVPVYRMGNIVEGKLVDDGFKYISPNIDSLPRLYLKPNDILFNRTNSYELVGKSAIYSGPDEYATFASYLIRARLFEQQLLPRFFSLAMNAPYFRATQIEPEIVQQCGQANFNGTKLSLCLLPVPPLPEQHRIVAKIDQLMYLCDSLNRQVDAATGKQTELLNAMIAGV